MAITATFYNRFPGAEQGLIPGIDVSGWQGQGTITDTRLDTRWAIIKTSEGANFFEPIAHVHLADAKARGIPTGWYHFAQPDRFGPDEEAAWFAGCIAEMGGPGEIVPTLDLEVGSGDLTGWVRTFNARMAAFGYPVTLLYASPSFIETHVSPIPGVPLWLAHYAPAAAELWVPAGWGDSAWVAWQWSSTALGSLDLNMARPELFDLNGGLGGASTTEDDELTEDEKKMLARIDAALANPGGYVAGATDVYAAIGSMINQRLWEESAATLARIDLMEARLGQRIAALESPPVAAAAAQPFTAPPVQLIPLSVAPGRQGSPTIQETDR